MSAIHVIVKSEIKQMIKACDEDTERDFLGEFGRYRNRLVYDEEILELETFDKICAEVLEEIES